MPVLVASVAEARAVAQLDDRAERLAAALWPGALTIVCPAPRAAGTGTWAAMPASIGIRFPDHRLARAVLGAGPLATTSANRSGEPVPPPPARSSTRSFGDAVAVYLCDERPLVGRASTVVSLLGPAPAILRGGDIDPAVVERLSAG